MSRSFLTSINLNQNQLLNASLQNLAAAPSTPVSGQVYYSTTGNVAYVYNGTAWMTADATKATGIPTSAIAGFQSTVQSYSLSSFAAPIANIAMGGYKLTGLPSPTTPGDSAEYAWVVGQIQSAAAGIASKPPVQANATANITLSGLQTIDGYTTLAGDRILSVGQTAATANGVYIAASGAWTRTVGDGAAPGEMEPGAMWLVVNGTVNAGTQWRCSNTGAITIGTTGITVVQFSAASPYSAGNGISLTGGAFSVNPVAAGGIIVAIGGASVDTTIVTRKYATTIGDGSTLAYVVTHNLGTQNVIMQARQSATPYSEVECDMAATSATTSTFTFLTAPSAGQYTVMVMG